MEVLFPPTQAGAAQEARIPPPVLDAPFTCRSWYGDWCAASTSGEVMSRVPVQPYSVADLKAYVGEYRSDDLGESFIIAPTTDGHLTLLRPRSEPIALTSLNRDRFFADFSDRAGTLTFLRAPSGDVTGFTISGKTPRRLSFTKGGIASSTEK